MVYKLNKALYGLKQALRAWNKRIDGFFVHQGFKKCSIEYGVYVKGTKETKILLVLVTRSCPKEIDKFKACMKEEFEMKELFH